MPLRDLSELPHSTIVPLNLRLGRSAGRTISSSRLKWSCALAGVLIVLTVPAPAVAATRPVTAVVASADVSLVKTLDTTVLESIGQSVAYTIIVANAGPSSATNVLVMDSPMNLSFTSISGACSSFPCLIAALPSGSSATINVTATISAEIFDNSATATASEPDPVPANNTDATGNGGLILPPPPPSADVSLVKSLITAGPYSAGQTVDYTLVVANAGPSTATLIQLTDMPTNLTITNVSGACTALPCTIAALASGTNTTVNVTATIFEAAAFDNAAAASAVLDPNPSNNTDNSGNGGVAAPSSDVSLVKTLVTAGPYTAGQPIDYTITVSNAGPSAASNIDVTEAPANLTITSVSGSSCSEFPCRIVSLDPGAQAVLNVTATPTAGGAFDNAATATGAQPDPATANNSDVSGNGGIAAAAIPTADVAVVKTLITEGPYFAGQSITYVIGVTNAGPFTATAIQVTDTQSNLATEVVFGGGCVAFPCTVPTLAAGDIIAFIVKARILAVGPFNNTATATAAEVDPSPANNTGSSGGIAALAAASVPTLNEWAVILLTTLMAALGVLTLRRLL